MTEELYGDLSDDEPPDDETVEEEDEERPPDHAVEEAKAQLRRFFRENPERVFYGRQLEVIHERTFFHWITTAALTELSRANVITASETTESGGLGTKGVLLHEGAKTGFYFTVRSCRSLSRKQPVRLGAGGSALAVVARAVFMRHLWP